MERLFKFDLISVWGHYLYYDECLDIVMALSRSTRACPLIKNALKMESPVNERLVQICEGLLSRSTHAEDAVTLHSYFENDSSEYFVAAFRFFDYSFAEHFITIDTPELEITFTLERDLQPTPVYEYSLYFESPLTATVAKGILIQITRFVTLFEPNKIQQVCK